MIGRRDLRDGRPVKLFAGPGEAGAAAGLPRSAYGSTLAHAGIGLMVIGIVATTAWQSERILAMKPASATDIAGYTCVPRRRAPRTGPTIASRSAWSHRDARRDAVTSSPLQAAVRHAGARPPRPASTLAGAATSTSCSATSGRRRHSRARLFQPAGAVHLARRHRHGLGRRLSLLDRRLRVGADRPRAAAPWRRRPGGRAMRNPAKRVACSIPLRHSALRAAAARSDQPRRRLRPEAVEPGRDAEDPALEARARAIAGAALPRLPEPVDRRLQAPSGPRPAPDRARAAHRRRHRRPGAGLRRRPLRRVRAAATALGASTLLLWLPRPLLLAGAALIVWTLAARRRRRPEPPLPDRRRCVQRRKPSACCARCRGRPMTPRLPADRPRAPEQRRRLTEFNSRNGAARPRYFPRKKPRQNGDEASIGAFPIEQRLVPREQVGPELRPTSLATGRRGRWRPAGLRSGRRCGRAGRHARASPSRRSPPTARPQTCKRYGALRCPSPTSSRR